MVPFKFYLKYHMSTLTRTLIKTSAERKEYKQKNK